MDARLPVTRSLAQVAVAAVVAVAAAVVAVVAVAAAAHRDLQPLVAPLVLHL